MSPSAPSASSDQDLRDQATSASAATFVTALVFNAIIFGAELGAFTLVYPYFKAVYEPRTYAVPPKKRSNPFSPSRFLWPLAVWRADHKAIKNVTSLDAYCFVRFLRMMTKIFLPIWLVSWIVLFPATTVNIVPDPSYDNLNKLSFSDVPPHLWSRYAAHVVMVYVFTFWIFYNISNEMHHYVKARQEHLIEHDHARSLQANTILVMGIPERYLSKSALLKVFEELPGGVHKIWINRNLKELPDIYDRRLAACNKLESAETSLLRTAARIRFEAQNQQQKNQQKNVTESNSADPKKAADPEAAPLDFVSGVPRDQRPSHRLGLIPFTGERVDTIEWAREEIKECNKLLYEAISSIEEEDIASAAEDISKRKAKRRNSRKPSDMMKDAAGVLKNTAEAVEGRIVGYGGSKYPPLTSAFITFNKQIGAHMATQALAHHDPYRMARKYNEISPQDVIWANLNLNTYEQKIRIAISYSATAALIIFWSFPVAFVGAISNIHSICSQVKWLNWICELPSTVVGIISGVLPPVMLAVLMALLPIILRLLARFEGVPKYTGLELSLMTRYFSFLVVHSFLIVTISSGIIPALQQILNDPTSIANTLATQLPQASTFFLTYIILQGLSGTASGFLQISPLVIYYVKLFLLGSTPRSVYSIKYVLEDCAWGTLFPSVTLLAVISITYSVISPLINGLAFGTFFAFYQLYKYLFLWVYEQKPSSDTGGLFFPKAIQQVFVGLYIEEVCLCGLFFLAHAYPHAILLIILIVFTVGFHMIVNHSYGPLLYALPLSLKDKTYSPVGGVTDNTESEAGSSGENLEQGQNADIEADDAQCSSPSKDKSRASENRVAAGERNEETDFGYAHPAISVPQRTIWIPRDALGMSEEEVRGCKEMGLSVSVEGATMNVMGKVDVPSADDVSEDVARSFDR